MSTDPVVTMRSAIEQILQAHGILERFLTSPTFYAEIKAKGHLPLWVRRARDHVTISHFRDFDGVVVTDPEMQFRMIDHMYVPVSVMTSTGRSFIAETESARRELGDLADLWAGNLLSFGYISGYLNSGDVQMSEIA